MVADNPSDHIDDDASDITSDVASGVSEDLEASALEADADIKPKKGTALPTVLVCSLAAALLGGAIGWVGPKLIDPANAAPAQAIASNTANAKSLSANVQSQSAEIERLTSRLTASETQLENLAKLQSRLQRLETAEQARAQIDIDAQREQAIAPLLARIDAMETLMQTEDMPEGAASALLSRLDDLESELEVLSFAPPAATDPIILSYKEGGSEALNALDEEVPQIIASAQSYDLLANFPREQMLTALRAQIGSSEKPSWLRRMLERHIEVRDVDGAQTVAVIDTAQDLTRSGDIAGAVEAIETLNPTLRAAARPWLLEAKKTL